MLHWLFEQDALDQEETDRLKDAAWSQGHNVKCLRTLDYWTSTLPEVLLGDAVQADDKILFYGSLQIAQRIQREKPNWMRPGVWLTLDNFLCSAYYPHFHNFMFNAPYAFMPVGTLLRAPRKSTAEFVADDCIFVRPDSGFKTFTGKVFEVPKLRTEFRNLRGFNRGIDSRANVLVSSPKDIGREWRMFVVNDEVVAGSQYRIARRFKSDPHVPAAVYAFARRVLREVTTFRPDPAFVMDVCEDADGDLWVLELNSFSCSGIYDADAQAIVRAVSGFVLAQQ